ncbi:MAG: ferritin-like domain-containing protein [Verrucomicrobia bacterium]|jgi:bacterioferritin|nr:ferritin-like domain-containing protein [Verrucomicrobiota bacterium]
MTTENTQILEGMNDDLAHEYQAVVMYNTFAATLVGPNRKELEDFFRSEIPDELRHAEFLGNKISALGGQPTTRIPEVHTPKDTRAMLEEVLKAETQTIERYTQRREQAQAMGDLALVNDLEEILSDETKHKEQTAKMLRGNWQTAAA